MNIPRYDPLARRGCAFERATIAAASTAATAAVAGKSATLLAEYGYRGPYALQTKTVGGLTTQTTFDAARRPVEIRTGAPDAPPVVSERIAWDSRNLKSAIQRDDLGGVGQLMAYDGAHRLKASAKVAQPLTFVAPNTQADASSVTGQSNHEAFTYDSAMNRTNRLVSKEGVVTSHPTPNDGSGRNRPASVDGVPLVWDDNGNLQQKGDTVMSYDFRNRLTTVERDGELVVEYTYDALNRRVTREAGGVTEAYAWDGNQEVEITRDGALVSRRVYGAGIDETVQVSRDSNGDGAIDSTYLTMFDSSNNLAVVTTLGGKPIERYEASAFGERRILVDSMPPVIEQVRTVGDALWLEISESVVGTELQEALAAGTLRLHDVMANEDLALAVEQPVMGGGQALRRIVITPDTAPAQGTSLELIVEPGVLVDSFANTPSTTYTLPVTWPSVATIVTDTAPPRVGAAIVRDGVVELELSEEVDPASTAITLDGANVAWTLSGDHYTLVSDQALAVGSHTLTVDTAPLDLAGSGLAEPFHVTFTVAAQGARLAYSAPDERETLTSTLGNDIGFHGRPVDEATGLMYFRNRWFDPELGRFTTPDPLGYVDGPSMYQFAGYSPANKTDPLGLSCPECRWKGGKPGNVEVTQGDRQVVSGGVSAIPIVGQAKDWQEVFSGVDLITGEGLSGFERGLTAGAGLIPFLPAKVIRGVFGKLNPLRWFERGASSGSTRKVWGVAADTPLQLSNPKVVNDNAQNLEPYDLWDEELLARSLPEGSRQLRLNLGDEISLSGHGGISIGVGGMVRIPEGTWLRVYSRPGELILDDLGNAIERLEDLSDVYFKTYSPGDLAPNLWLSPPKGLTLIDRPWVATVKKQTYLSNILKPNMGLCHWAACQHISTHRLGPSGKLP